MNRTRLILAVLLPLLIVTIISAWLRMPRQKRIDRLTYRPFSSLSGQTATAGRGGGVLRDGLQVSSSSAVRVHRNIFRPLAGDRGTAAPRGSAAAPTSRTGPATPASPPPPTPQELARQQLDAFTVLGAYTRKGIKIVFLARGEEIITVRVGDMPIPGYRVVAIDDERMTLRSQDGSHQLVATL